MFHYRDYKVTERRKLFNFIAQYPFATVMKSLNKGDYPAEAYAPVIKHKKGLQFHIAKANSAYPVFRDGGKAVITFVGPNAPVSPSWYRTRFAEGDRSHTAPTWDYALVRAKGELKPMDERALEKHLKRLVGQFEGAIENGWDFEEIDPAFKGKLTRLIAGYDFEIREMEGYFKLSQEQNDADRESVREELHERNRGFDRALAKMMKTYG